MSILNEDEGWRPAITIKQMLLGMYIYVYMYIYTYLYIYVCICLILIFVSNISTVGIQELLDNPNPKSPAQREAFDMFINDKKGMYT